MIGGLVLYFLTPEERWRLAEACRALLRRAGTAAVRRLTRRLDEAGESQSVAIATWFLVLVNVWVFARMLVGVGRLGDANTLISWGGSFGPSTTNGEWWRLVAATFVHAGPLHLLATLAGLIQIGSITERLVGRFAFLSTYVAAGALGNLVCLSTSPLSVTVGGAAAVLGIYGLLIATSIWGLLRGSRVSVPWCTAKRLIPGVAFFLLYNTIAGRFDRVVLATVLAGATIGGLLLAKGAREHIPSARRVAYLFADTAALIVAFAIPLRGMANVMPQIDRLMAAEVRTAKAYDAAVAKFADGYMSAGTLAQLIDGTILPDLAITHAGLDALERVPPDYQPLVARAEEYFRLRHESWRLRSEALHNSRPRLLKEADGREWQALDVLQAIREFKRK